MIELRLRLSEVNQIRSLKKLLKLTHREIFSKSYQIKQKSDCIYRVQVDFEHKQTRPFAVPNQSVHGKYNLISI